MRTLRVFSEFQEHKTVLLTIVTTLYLDPRSLFILSLKLGILWPAFPHFPHPVATTILCVRVCVCVSARQAPSGCGAKNKPEREGAPPPPSPRRHRRGGQACSPGFQRAGGDACYPGPQPPGVKGWELEVGSWARVFGIPESWSQSGLTATAPLSTPAYQGEWKNPLEKC